jgi:hypothetical protein
MPEGFDSTHLPPKCWASTVRPDDAALLQRDTHQSKRLIDIRWNKPIPMSTIGANRFYDELVPHVSHKLIKEICRYLSNQQTRLSSIPGTSFASKVNNLWKKQDWHNTTIPPKWVQNNLKLALLGRLDKLNLDQAPTKIKSQHWEETIQLLMRLRDHHLKGDIAWSMAHRKRVKTEGSDKHDMSSQSTERGDKIRNRHKAKTQLQLRAEAEALLNHLVANLPEETLLEWLEKLKFSCESISSPTSAPQRANRLILSSLLNSSASWHAHWVMEEIAAFLYHELSDAEIHDKRLEEARTANRKLRQRFTDAILSFQAHWKLHSEPQATLGGDDDDDSIAEKPDRRETTSDES